MKTGNITEKRWYPIMIGIMYLTVLGINLLMVTKLLQNLTDNLDPAEEALRIDYLAARPAAIFLFAAIALFHLIQGLCILRESKLHFLKHLAYAIFSGVSALLLFKEGSSPFSWAYAGFYYMLAVLIGRVIELIRKRSKLNIVLLVLTVLLTLFIGAATLVMKDPTLDPEGTVPMTAVLATFLLIDFQAVASIMPLAFSHIRMDVLKRIIRKTYAVEILSGILLLIVAFSFVLPAFETGINNFWDALWYCFAIVTTIGFGDLYAVSAVGRVLSVILGIYGIIVVSLITSIIVNFYGEMKKEERDDEE